MGRLTASLAWRAGGVGIAYLVFAAVGASIAGKADSSIAPAWLASGMAIAALALRGPALWPGIAVGAFVAALLLSDHPPGAALGIALGATLESVLAAQALRRLAIEGETTSIRAALAILATILLAPLVSAAAGTLALGLSASLAPSVVALEWWERDSIGILIALPAVLAWTGKPATPSAAPRRPYELAGALALVLALVAAFSLGGDVFHRFSTSPPMGVALLPPVLWAIFRLRQREAILVLAVGCFAAIAFTAAFRDAGHWGPLVSLHMMLLTVGGAALVILGAIADRWRTEGALQASRELLSYALSAGHSGTFYWNPQTNENRWSDELLALYGLRREDFGERIDDWLRSLLPEHRDEGMAAIAQSLKTGDFNLDFQIRRADTGENRWLAGRAKVAFDAAGRPTRMIGINTDITDRKKTELALKASETQLKIVVEHAPVGIVYLSLPERRILWANRAFCEMTGYSQSELGECTSLDLTLPEDRAAGQHEYSQLTTFKLASFKFEKRYARKDGSVIWARSAVSAVSEGTESKNASYAINIVEDVTKEKLADQARREAEQRLQLAMEIAELGAWEFDVAHDRLKISPAWRRKLGFDDDEKVDSGEFWRSRIHPDDQPRVRNQFNDYLAKPEGEYRIEYRFRVADGSYRWIASRAVAIGAPSAPVERLVGAHLDITERKGAEQRIREESLHDPLTKLPNRALLTEYGTHVLGAAERNGSQCAVLFVDLDRFKPINDTYGHEAGDAVLKEVARRLRRCTRQGDLVGRLGGDEFLVVLSHIDREHHRVDTVAQHVLEAVARPIVVGALELSVSPSVGVACFPEHGTDMDSLIQNADLAMYRAKQDGRGDYRTYSPDLRRQPDESRAWKTKVKCALRRGGMVLHYQPITSLHDGHLVAAEALVRMLTTDGRTLGAYSFMPATESSELGVELDEWVLVTACRQHREWIRQGLSPIPISVNISPQQFRHPGFAKKLGHIVSRSGIDPALLQIEIAGSLVEGDEITTDLFRELKSIGVKLALDGFGAGPISLPQISRLPINRIKMEQSLLRGIGRGVEVENVPTLIIALGKILKFDVVGEGVESEEMLRSVRQSGCDAVQGFYLCRPLPPEDFARWYRRHGELH